MTRDSLRLLVALALLAGVFTGCIGANEARQDTGEGAGATDEVVVREHTLNVEYYARAGILDTQNMEETNWEIQIPANVTQVRALATWEPSTPFAEDQALMLHEGSREDPGPMFAEPGVGSSPIETAWTAIPEGLETVTIMCHVYTSGPDQPVGIEVEQETDITVEFR